MRINALSVVSELAASQHNVFTRHQAAERGIRRDHIATMIAAHTVVPMESGGLVILPGPNGATWRQRVTGAVLDHPGTVASHTTAARLDGIDGFDVFDTVELSVTRPRVLRIPGVTVHRVDRLDRCDLVAIDGVASTNRARTLCDLGCVVESLMVARALDDAVRRGASLRWISSTADRLHRPGQAGTGELRRAVAALEKRGRVSDSWFERLVELCLDDPSLGAVVPQYTLRSEDGTHAARFDLAIPEVKLAIEAHSRDHHFTEEEKASDEHRDQAVSEEGWDVMYLGYQALRSPTSVQRRVRARVEARRKLIGSGA